VLPNENLHTKNLNLTHYLFGPKNGEYYKYNDRTVDRLNTLNTILSSPVYSAVDEYYFASEHKKRRYWYQLLQGPVPASVKCQKCAGILSERV